MSSGDERSRPGNSVADLSNLQMRALNDYFTNLMNAGLEQIRLRLDEILNSQQPRPRTRTRRDRPRRPNRSDDEARILQLSKDLGRAGTKLAHEPYPTDCPGRAKTVLLLTAKEPLGSDEPGRNGSRLPLCWTGASHPATIWFENNKGQAATFMTEKSDHAEPIIESTQVKMTAGNESEERDESEKTESEGVEEVDVEDVELLINIKNKAKSKKRKAPTSIQKQQSCMKVSHAERSVDLDAEDTWGFLDVIKKGHLERTVTGLVEYIPEIVKEFYAALPEEITRLQA
ncbi:hypothetical protein F2Q69_00020675 [Brassica cretica]|uniref:Uncharacterized protein n=1 Tax=Brassica cretica TaxID=69181 RepID=A0A8S9QKM4_BRACR|nr:hypothetical protein F2Q69_00020675 [Brassica cretica]